MTYFFCPVYKESRKEDGGLGKRFSLQLQEMGSGSPSSVEERFFGAALVCAAQMAQWTVIWVPVSRNLQNEFPDFPSSPKDSFLPEVFDRMHVEETPQRARHYCR